MERELAEFQNPPNGFKDDIEIEDRLGDEDVLPFQYSISSYGVDFDIAGLVRRLKEGDIVLPSFQRGYVWEISRASQFVESLLLGLPVPGIFLSTVESNQKLLVVDGSQRLRTLKMFYENDLELIDVQKQFLGLTYSSLQPTDRRRLDNSILHATVVRQEDPSDDNSSVYFVFRRLNTGAMPLKPQEIRAAIYGGLFNQFLDEVNSNPIWRDLYGKSSPDQRRRDQEMILRFFALYFYSQDYARPMEDFLNRYMVKNRNLQFQSKVELLRIFENTIEVIQKCLGKKAFRLRGPLNVALFDAVMVGVAKRLQNKGDIPSCDSLNGQYTKLLADQTFVDAITKATATEEHVKQRIERGIRYFADVE